MPQVLIYTNTNGGVSVCVPTGEMPIEQVLDKDCPAGALIVEDTALPNEDGDFFDAWELNNGVVTVNLTKAKAVQLARFNAAAVVEAQHRANNTAIGLTNDVDDATFLAGLSTKRNAITMATTTAELRMI
jgi:hypothetical protein